MCARLSLADNPVASQLCCLSTLHCCCHFTTPQHTGVSGCGGVAGCLWLTRLLLHFGRPSTQAGQWLCSAAFSLSSHSFPRFRHVSVVVHLCCCTVSTAEAWFYYLHTCMLASSVSSCLQGHPALTFLQLPSHFERTHISSHSTSHSSSHHTTNPHRPCRPGTSARGGRVWRVSAAKLCAAVLPRHARQCGAASRWAVLP